MKTNFQTFWLPCFLQFSQITWKIFLNILSFFCCAFHFREESLQTKIYQLTENALGRHFSISLIFQFFFCCSNSPEFNHSDLGFLSLSYFSPLFSLFIFFLHAFWIIPNKNQLLYFFFPWTCLVIAFIQIFLLKYQIIVW